jgi:hypothetical protein
MNWYKKISQRLEDVSQEDYEDADMYQAARYFSIGQDEPDPEDDNAKDTYCWIWIDRTLYVAKGKSHNMQFSNIHGFNLDKNYRGWHDPNQNIVSIIIPRPANMNTAQYGEDDIPEQLNYELRETFGHDYRYEVF